MRILTLLLYKGRGQILSSPGNNNYAQIKLMQDKPEREPTLAEMEEEVLKEGREWTRDDWSRNYRDGLMGSASLFPLGAQAPACDVKRKLGRWKAASGGLRLKRITGRSPAVGAGFARSGRPGYRGASEDDTGS